MNLRVSRSFIEGMKYPRTISSRKNHYTDSLEKDSVTIAWKRTGDYLRRAIKNYEKEKGEGNHNK